jgi:hypothetical protein
MPSEHAEHQATIHALDHIDAWMRPQTNEGITFALARVTGDLATSSFLGGGDLSLYTPASPRGSLRAQLSNIELPDGSGGLLSQPLDLTFDLRTAKVVATYTDPATLIAATAHLTVEHDLTVGPVGARYYVFHADHVDDGAGWMLALTLL